MVRAVFRPEAELTLFLRMRTKEIAKIQRKCISTEELFTCYRKSASPKRTARSIFDQNLVNRRFCACAVKSRPKTRLLCCQIATVLAPLWAYFWATLDICTPVVSLLSTTYAAFWCRQVESRPIIVQHWQNKNRNMITADMSRFMDKNMHSSVYAICLG